MVCGSNRWWIPFMMIHYFVFMDEFGWNKTNRTLVIIMDEVIIKRMHKPFICIAELPRCGPDRTGRGKKNNNTLPKFCTGRFVYLFTDALHKSTRGGRTLSLSLSLSLSLVESAIVLSFLRLVFISSWVKLLRTRSGRSSSACCCFESGEMDNPTDSTAASVLTCVLIIFALYL
jgi:hypothetical protein